MAERPSGVQTVERALGLLDAIADAGGPVTVTALANASDLPLPTAFRLLASMKSLGYVSQLPSRRYVLGPRLIRLGESAQHALSASARQFLVELVDRTQETANLAVLDGDALVYVAQAPSPHSMRTFTEDRKRVLPHATGVGKALLAQMDDQNVRDLLARTGMPRVTDRTITDVDELLANLRVIRSRGWSEDDGEQELGVRCVAAAIPGAGIPVAVSISGPDARISHEHAPEIAPIVLEIAKRMTSVFESDV